jgi:hypothetical protein
MDTNVKKKPYLVLARLTGNAFYHQRDIERLKSALPACTRGVIFDGHVIGLMTLCDYSPDAFLGGFARELRSFESVTVVELGSASASTNGLLDPLNSWMDLYVRRGTGGQSDQAEDMLKSKWGERRGEYPKEHGIADAIGKVFSRRR